MNKSALLNENIYIYTVISSSSYTYHLSTVMEKQGGRKEGRSMNENKKK
jgi:hypothetical protein